MTHEDAFLQDICDNPDDDAPRLIFADWLEDHDQSQRAEFIRAQCRLAHLDPDDPQRLPLEAIERAFLPTLQRELDENRKLPAWARSPLPRFERGFLAEVSCTAVEFGKDWNKVLRLAPVQHLTLNNAKRYIDRLTGCTTLHKLRSLNLADNDIGHNSLLKLLAIKGLDHLRSLNLASNRLGLQSATTLAQHPAMQHLRSLNLSINGLFVKGIESLAQSPHFSQLRELNLRGTRLNRNSIVALANSLAFPELRKLDLQGNALTGEDLEPLAEGTNFRKLESLNLIDNPLSDVLLARLLTSANLPNLCEIFLALSQSNSSFWRIQPDSARMGKLKLSFSSADLQSTKNLDQSPLLAACRSLSFGWAFLNTEAFVKMLGSPVVYNLSTLVIYTSDLDPRVLRALAQSPHLGSLRRLTLGIFARGQSLRPLFDGPVVQQLTHLHLAVSDITPDHIDSLTQPKQFDNLDCLRLQGWGINDTDLPALREHFGPRLEQRGW